MLGRLLPSSQVRILSHFSIQSNILRALVMMFSARRAWAACRGRGRAAGPCRPSALTGAALLYAMITALVYHLLPANEASPFPLTGEAAEPTGRHTTTNQVIHTVVPVAALLDWLLLTPSGRLRLRQAAPWLLYPLLDVDAHGYKSVLGNACLLGLSFGGLAILLVALDHARPNPVRHSAKTGFRLQPPVG